MTKHNTESHAKQILKTAGLYRTPCRLAILDILVNSTKPQNQEQIAQQMASHHFDKVTIYRTLESFCAANLVHKAYMEKRAWYFELAHNCTASQCHPHFTCTGCGDTHCMVEISVPMPKSPHKGFVIRRQQVRLEGLCPNCSSNAGQED